jgi:hypothetical protein
VAADVRYRNDGPNRPRAAIEVSSFSLDASTRGWSPRCEYTIRSFSPTATDTSRPPIVASIAWAHGAWIRSTATLNDGVGVALGPTVVRGDAVGVTVDVEADGTSEATCDACVQPAAQTASATAANIPRGRDRTGSLLTCSPS